MRLYFNTGFKEVWDETTIRSKLTSIACAKKNTWIHVNLSVSQSTPFSCLGWKVAKHFSCLRDLYFINPSRSAQNLSRLGARIAKHPDQHLYKLFCKAANNFTLITGYTVAYPEWKFAYQNPPVVISNPPEYVNPVMPQVVIDSEPSVVHQTVVHEHHHVSPIPRVIHSVPVIQPTIVVPPTRPIRGVCVNPPYAPPRMPTPPVGCEIPGTGRGDPLREVAPNLARQGVHVVNQPTVVAPRQAPPPPVGCEIPGTGRGDPLREVAPNLARHGVRVVNQPTVVAPRPAPHVHVPRQAAHVNHAQARPAQARPTAPHVHVPRQAPAQARPTQGNQAQARPTGAAQHVPVGVRR